MPLYDQRSQIRRVCTCSVDTYQVGKEVVIRVHDHEMTAKFMGYEKDMTLLEADASLVGIKFVKR